MPRRRNRDEFKRARPMYIYEPIYTAFQGTTHPFLHKLPETLLSQLIRSSRVKLPFRSEKSEVRLRVDLHSLRPHIDLRSSQWNVSIKDSSHDRLACFDI